MATKKKVVIEDRRQETDETAEVTKDQLLALGAEMNTLLFPGEEVDFTKMDEDGILEQIKADAGSIDPGDQFSDESKATLAAIGVDVEWTVPEEKPAAKGKAAAKPKAEKKATEPKAEKKVSEPKAEKEPKQAKNENTIAGLIRSIMTESKDSWMTSDDDILAKVKESFPDSNTNLQNIVWYRYDTKKKGLIPTK